MRFLARVLLLVQLVALVGSAVGAEAEVEARAEQLTVSGSGAAGKGVSCFVKGQTFLCPHDGGICCDGLAVCCPSGFKCSGSVSAPKCSKLPSVPVALTNPAGRSSESSALSLSPKKKKKGGENDKKKKRKHRKRRHRRGPRIIQVILKNYNGGANAGTSSSLTTATKNGVPVAPSANGKQLFNLRKLRGVLVAPGLHKAVKGRIIGHTAMLPAKPVRAYAFWVKPTGRVPSWGSIFHVGNQNMERGPGVWFYPNKTSIHFRHSSQNNTNNGPDSKAENGIGELPLNVWTHVALTHDAGSVKIFYNGTVVSTTPNVQGPIRFVAPIYFSDPWHDAAKAEFRDIRLYPFNKGLTETEVKTIHALSKSNQLGPKKLDF